MKPLSQIRKDRVAPCVVTVPQLQLPPSPPSVAPSHTQLSSTVLHVLSCGSEWGGAESGPGHTPFDLRICARQRQKKVMSKKKDGPLGFCHENGQRGTSK